MSEPDAAFGVRKVQSIVLVYGLYVCCVINGSSGADDARASTCNSQSLELALTRTDTEIRACGFVKPSPCEYRGVLQ